MDAGNIKIDTKVNLNTVIAVVGFALSIGVGLFTVGTNYSQLTAFQQRQEDYNKNLDADRRAGRAQYDTKLDALVDAVGKQINFRDQASVALAQLQKKDEEVDARLARMAESYSDKFTEIQASLSDLKMGQALQNQMFNEFRQAWMPDKPPNVATQEQR